MSEQSSFPKIVESIVDCAFFCCLVDVYLSDIGEQRKVDAHADIFLVVQHQFAQARIIVARDGGTAIVSKDIAGDLL